MRVKSTRWCRAALLGRRGARPKKGLFDPDNFTFGTQLQRSALEAVIQELPGVRAVLGIRIRIRRRGRASFENFDRFTLEDLAPNEVIQLENDPAIQSAARCAFSPKGARDECAGQKRFGAELGVAAAAAVVEMAIVEDERVITICDRLPGQLSGSFLHSAPSPAPQMNAVAPIHLLEAQVSPMLEQYAVHVVKPSVFTKQPC